MADAFFTPWYHRFRKMPRDAEIVPVDRGPADGDHRRDRTRERPSSTRASHVGGRVTRRRALAATGLVALGTTAGCLGSIPGFEGSRTEVEPEEPGDDPDATPGEFYYRLEETDISVDELYHDTAEDDLILFYESDAETPAESDTEIIQIYEVFRDGLVDHGTDVELLFTEVRTAFDEQVEGWGVNSQWAEMELDDEVTVEDILVEINTTKVYPDGVEPPTNDTREDGNDSVIEVGDENGTESDSTGGQNDTRDELNGITETDRRE